MDFISKDVAIEALAKAGIENYAAAGNDNGMLKAVNVIKAIPAAQPTQTNAEPNAESTKDFDKDTNVHSTDTISRQDAIDEIMKCRYVVDAIEKIKALPSAQPEPLSDAYTKAVWTWLLDYQIKAAELKGRYTPYEVLSWVANDWRKEHE